MRAIVLGAPGPPETLTIRTIPVPTPQPGCVLIRVKAFGLNRSELHTRLGLASGVSFPRVPGIEATGIVAEPPAASSRTPTRHRNDGRDGRTYDGGYAE
jgi:NADPH:quinone reductase-like Zn-dependent oxidoreductase